MMLHHKTVLSIPFVSQTLELGKAEMIVWLNLISLLMLLF